MVSRGKLMVLKALQRQSNADEKEFSQNIASNLKNINGQYKKYYSLCYELHIGHNEDTRNLFFHTFCILVLAKSII